MRAEWVRPRSTRRDNASCLMKVDNVGFLGRRTLSRGLSRCVAAWLVPWRMPLRVRPAVPADAPEVARVYVESWRWAYAGVLPQRYLEGLSAERQVPHWAALIGAKTRAITWVAQDERGCCGMASVGPARSRLAGVGEVYTLYVSERAARQGVGRLLLAYGVAQLKATLHASAILWVLEDNQRARHFYERQGWSPDGARQIEQIAGMALSALRYRRAL
jgi:ribosomal protein S18 acetylase RimI-like enzyme